MTNYDYEFSVELDWQHHNNWQTPDTPFMQFAFWQALQDSEAIGAEAGWLPIYILVKNKANADQLCAVMPVFIKDHHQGEYVFDYAWAEAYERYRRDYYPRLVTSVPFTPVTGERVWLVAGQALDQTLWQTIQQAIDALAVKTQASSWHGLFMQKSMLTLGQSAPDTYRVGCQFMWHNHPTGGEKFANFDDFLAILTAKKRKSIRVERQKVAQQGLNCQVKLGDDITDEDWQIFYQCYAMTYLVRGRQPYLSLAFFLQIGQHMANNLMLAQATDTTGEIVASSLFFYDKTTLYGRYWGCLAEYDSLHFELCYYQGIEFAIHRGLQYFDPGTQGEHKLIRGFIPMLTYSLHKIYDQGFVPAIQRFCQQERQAVLAYYEDVLQAVPFNQDYKSHELTQLIVDNPVSAHSR